MIRTITRDRGLVVQLDYQRERFDEATAAAWHADHLRSLRALASAPTRRSSRL